MARKTLAQLLTEVNALLADNQEEDISAEDLRTILTDIRDSFTHLDDTLVLGATSATAYRGDRGTTAYNHSQASGNPHGTAIADIAGLVSALNVIATKADIGAALKSGTVVKFDQRAIYGSIAHPETGNITFDNVGATKGVINTMIHNHTGTPTFGAEFHAKSNSEAYITGTMNFITFELIDTAYIIYEIHQ